MFMAIVEHRVKRFILFVSAEEMFSSPENINTDKKNFQVSIYDQKNCPMN